MTPFLRACRKFTQWVDKLASDFDLDENDRSELLSVEDVTRRELLATGEVLRRKLGVISEPASCSEKIREWLYLVAFLVSLRRVRFRWVWSLVFPPPWPVRPSAACRLKGLIGGG